MSRSRGRSRSGSSANPKLRDYLDVAALTESIDPAESARILAVIDRYYGDDSTPDDDSVATQVARQLASPSPKDHRGNTGLARYKGLIERWHDWDSVVSQCRAVSAAMLEIEDEA